MKPKPFLLFLFLVITSTSTTSESSFVDPNIVLQNDFKGWGTSLAWWADMVGGMDDDIVDYVVDAIFSPDKLNLNIARYVIGGTSSDGFCVNGDDYRAGAKTESFQDGLDKPYNWERDLRQRKILLAAKAKGANLFEAFSNTPPDWLTISKCSRGNTQNFPLHSNFDASNSEQFAKYATDVIAYFHDNLNITFSTYSPFNEPIGLHGIGAWDGKNSKQEGCNMNRTTMISIIESVHAAITSKNLTFLKIAVSDETQVNTQIQSYDTFTSSGVANLFSQVNVHGYWDNIELSRKDLLSLKCRKGGHELWMDEMGWEGSGVDMTQGLQIANRIILDLRNMMPSAWVYWQVVEEYGGWGLLQVPYVDPSTDKIIFNSAYHALKQFRYQLVYTSDENSIAAISLSDQKLVIVSVNPTAEEATQDFDLSLFSEIGAPALFRTSEIEQHVDLPPPTISAGNKVTIQLPAKSFSTLEFSNVQVSNQTNLIKNGDFESVSKTETNARIPATWERVGDETGVSEEDAWREDYSGFLQFGLGRASALVQTLELSSSCTLYLTAWCSSTLPGTKLGVYINGYLGPIIDIKSNGAYSSYGISFSAKRNDTLQLYFSNTGTRMDGSAKIDEVFLRSKCT